MNFELEPPRSEQFVALQREVQRKLGRCLIRLQQYERLLKALIVEQDIGGTASAQMDIRATRADGLSKKTLGQVMGVLTDTVLTTDSPPSDVAASDDEPFDGNELRIWTRFNIEVPAEHQEKTLADLRALVDLRNELVHHLLEKQDIWTELGCVTAQSYLDECYAQIDERYLELHAWAKGAMEAREYMASFMQTPEFLDLILHGILPGGAGVECELSTIVRLLREAETVLAQGDWTSLPDAIALIQKKHPEHTLRRYGCTSWRQVLSESRQFVVRKEQAGPALPTKVWYRSKGK